MTIQTLRRFWKTLEQVPGGETDGREWRLLLGDEWRLASRYLRATDDRADAVSCPSRGGDECPRKVIALGGSRYRAVCQARPPLCDPLDLDATDVAVFALDRPKLFKDLAAALDSVPSAAPRASRDAVVEVGRYAVAAGVSAPVYLALPDPRDTLGETDFRASGLGRDPAVILLLAQNALTPALRGKLQDDGHEVFLLPDVVGATQSAGLATMQPVSVLLQRVHAALQARMAGGATVPAWPLPPDTRWEQITMRLISPHEIACSAMGETRPLDPGVLGLRNVRNGKPVTAWAIVTAMAVGRGRFRIRDPKGREKGKKQVEAIRAAFRSFFGLTDDPIPWDRNAGEYAARFTISDEVPQQARERARR